MLRSKLLHLQLLWRSAPYLSTLCVLLAVAGAGARTAALLTTGQLIGSLPDAIAGGPGSAEADTAWRWLLATALVFLAAPVASALLELASRAVSARYLVLLCDLEMEVGTHPYGIGHLEDSEWAGRMSAVTRAPRDWFFLGGIEAVWTLLSARLAGIGALVVLFAWSWWVPWLLAGAWLFFARSYARWTDSMVGELAQMARGDQRRANYFRSLLIDPGPAKEVRLFGLADWAADRYSGLWWPAMARLWDLRNASIRATLLALLLPAAGNVVAFALLGHDAWTGVMGGGLLVTLVQAVLAMTAFGPHNDPQMFLARTTSVVEDLVDLREAQGLPACRRGSTRACHLRADCRGAAAIELRNVTFGYDASMPVLANLELSIPAGQSIALVGLNGAGKSTLIKLLCGLYRPDSGTVRIDGRDPEVEDAARRRVAVIFQDFVRYHLSLRENVGLGVDDEPVLSRALADAGADSLLERLDWDTVLSGEYDGGTDLSGGQWQRVALARALTALAHGAGVLVLDEPTAALDIRAEAALFDRFLDVSRGATTILVSHRLSSVRHADRIVVLGDSGRIVEDGNHDQLMAQGSRYAELFSLQARRFAAAGR